MLAGIVILTAAAAALLIALAAAAYNRLVRLQVSCDEAYATMDVYLKKRFDLIPNLVAAVQGYAQHEVKTLELVTQMRERGGAGQTKEILRQESEISSHLRQIMALAEAYPQLKANAGFMQLTEKLQQTETDIANARKYYNGVVRQYNTALLTIPTNVFAGILGYQPRPLFEVDEAAERQNIRVEF